MISKLFLLSPQAILSSSSRSSTAVMNVSHVEETESRAADDRLTDDEEISEADYP
jgi:hypothetical protein